MASVTETISYKYNADTGEFVTNVNNAKQSESDFEQQTKNTGSSIDVMSGKFVTGAAAVYGLSEAFDAMNSSATTSLVSQSKVTGQLGLTEEQTNALNKSNADLGKTYGITSNQMDQVSSLNSGYVTSQEELASANKLVAQTATLYALKEGDVTKASEQTLTAQEALRDVIITGSTTAFEDSGISLDVYGQKLIETTGYTDEQVAAITAGTNGQLEYVEALSKSASPQQRFIALSAATDQEMTNLSANTSESAQTMITFNQNITAAKNALMGMIEQITIIVAKFINLIAASWQVVAVFGIMIGVIWLMTSAWIADAIAMALANIWIILIIAAVLALMVAYQQSIVVQNIVNKLLQIMVTIFMMLYQVIITYIIPAFLFFIQNVLLPIVIPVLQLLGTIIQTVVIPVFMFLYNILTTFVIPVFMFLYNVIMTYIMPIVVALANIITAILVVAFQILGVVIELITSFFEALNFVIGKVIDWSQKLADKIRIALQPAFETLEPVINAISDAFNFMISVIQSVITWIDNLISKILDGLIGALNSIPFVNVGTEASADMTTTGAVARSSQQPSALASGYSGGNTYVSNTYVTNRNVDISNKIQTTKTQTLTQATRDSIFMARNKGVFV